MARQFKLPDTPLFEVILPRSIGFTTALYSIGIPPELIGTGRGLRSLTNDSYSTIVTKVSSLELLEAQIEKYLGEQLEPVTKGWGNKPINYY